MGGFCGILRGRFCGIPGGIGRRGTSRVAPRDHWGVGLCGLIGRLKNMVESSAFFLRLRWDSGIHVVSTDNTNVSAKR